MSSLLELRNVSKVFSARTELLSFLGRKTSEVTAVADVSISVPRGSVLGIVGESGSGKSTLGQIATLLLRPSAGRIYFDGIDVTNLSGAGLRRFRQQAQIVFQDSSSALNPRKTIRRALFEPLALRGVSKEERAGEAEALVKSVGLTTDVLQRFPHQLSGGQRQRIGIARALAMKPQFILADEPVSALDVSLQAHVMSLLMDLRRDFNLTMVVISHDVSLVGAISNEIAVMYAGRLVEIGKPGDVLRNARHPYTQMLLESIPTGLAGRSRIRERQTSVRSNGRVSAGCPFAKRCPHVMDTCLETEPHLRPVSINHNVACHLQSERNEQHVAL